ncbi:hypothetical protein M427DRAFT_62535 [Gonapodya prolifera JEL478]|uniref:AB hydrolase-1 domain-containing protein n=1 Tax=Gonapodya prolifera (strain JEL478) TaxID=1344416 RepID=A0A139A0S5_GONPJ|nr:hypothetical protein M427DRAFT_62535 [Gonapodya prolifera JEL478]|eukprot:KXS10342.1 hypothetical protein M427DRAFT_62535 [Gonapodya prolifera JEL478]
MPVLTAAIVAAVLSPISLAYWRRFTTVSDPRPTSRKPWDTWPRPRRVPEAGSGIEVQTWEEEGRCVEVWVKKAEGTANADLPPFVFVPGEFQSPTSFAPYLSFFSSRDTDCFAISLSPTSHTRGSELWRSYNELAADVAVVLERLASEGRRAPVVFVHSTSTHIIDHLLSHPPQSLVPYLPKLLSCLVRINAPQPGSVPVWLRRAPSTSLAVWATLTPTRLLPTPASAGAPLLGPDATPEEVKRAWDAMDRVAPLALLYPPPFRLADPVRILDACAGKIVTVTSPSALVPASHGTAAHKTFRSTARFLGGKTPSEGDAIAVKYVEVQGGHLCMMEGNWEEAAEKVGEAVMEAIYGGGRVLVE